MDSGWRQEVGKARELIAQKAHRIARRLGPTVDSAELEQIFALNLVRRAPQFDPARSPWIAFVRMISEHCVSALLAQHDSPRGRWLRGLISLSMAVDVDGKVPLAAVIVERERPLSDCELCELRMDLQTVGIGLSPELQRTCRALARHSITEAAKQLGISRATLYARIAVLRRRFIRGNLQDYLLNSPDSRRRRPVSE